ncbi:MAG: AraC family transcriptional regulator [Acidobacteria bacterium]|nr:AraC family transcriptional regulator [Acidobacteriota bacterium]
MPLPTENPITFHAIYHSPILSVSFYSCRIGRGGPEAEEYSNVNQIVLMRQGVFCRHFGRRNVTADVNHAVFFSRDSTYRVSHPAECGDRGTILTPSPDVLLDIIRELDPSIDDHSEWTFPFISSPCDSGIFWRHYELVRRLEASQSDPPNPVWIDETGLELIAGILESALVRQGRPLKRHRTGTDADHAARAEEVKAYLASRLGERITLDDVARAVYASPFHLARIFHQRTGLPIHRYLTRLRIRASLDKLADGADDLTALALELGFSSHSHFTDSFRREFGRTPSDVRRNAGRRMLREMSKNLEV